MSYYYTCGVHRETQEVTCLRSETGFAEFENPHEYTRKSRYIFSKDTAEKRLVLSTPIVAKRTILGFETSEYRILCKELNTNSVTILKK